LSEGGIVDGAGKPFGKELEKDIKAM